MSQDPAATPALGGNLSLVSGVVRTLLGGRTTDTGLLCSEPRWLPK